MVALRWVNMFGEAPGGLGSASSAGAAVVEEIRGSLLHIVDNAVVLMENC